jgi:hypothetical protein
MALIGANLLLLNALAQQDAQLQILEEPKVDLDKQGLVQVEDLSESLANWLLEFSVAVRDRNLEELAAFFGPQIHTSEWPDTEQLEAEAVKWIQYSRDAMPSSRLQTLSEREALERWASFLSTFESIEDARFKVKDAEFQSVDNGLEGAGKIKFFLVGRDEGGQRLWVKGTGHVTALQAKQVWKLSELTFDDVNFYSASVDLFSEVSTPAGVAISLPPYGSPGNDDFVYHGGAAGDLDLDGWVDLISTGVKQTYLYLNQGNGTFREAAWELMIPPNSKATGAHLIDFDNDGDLDVFLAAIGPQMLFENRLKPDVASYNRYGLVMPNSWHRATNGTPNLLFINKGNGVFKESAQEWGVRDTRWSYAAQFADLNGDGRQDLYVANDFGENAFFINKGDHFVDRAEELGVLDPGNGMGVSYGDYNNDGYLDIFVTNMSSTAGNRILNRLFPDTDSQDNVLRKLAAGSNLFRGQSDGSFTDVTAKTGPFSNGWSWGGVFLDFDNDGWLDIYKTNGFMSGKSMKDT